MQLSLRNLATIGQLVEHETDKEQVGKLLDAAARCVDDARAESISMETRLIDAAVHLQEKLQRWLAKNRPDLLG